MTNISQDTSPETLNRKEFEQFIYTPLSVALEELKKRRDSSIISDFLKCNIGDDLPSNFLEKPRAVLFRQLATPNYEVRRFISIASDIEEISPLLWEYYSDKFTSNNEWKRSLGKLLFFHGYGKKGGMKVSNKNIIDFNSYVGKRIDEVKTLWGENLIDFHHNLFTETFPNKYLDFFDASDWFKRHGGNALEYYPNFLALFLRNGILFENFTLNEQEFTEKVFFPAFQKIYQMTGFKPLIVPLEPTEIEDSEFWLCHPSQLASLGNEETINPESYVDSKLESLKIEFNL